MGPFTFDEVTLRSSRQIYNNFFWIGWSISCVRECVFVYVSRQSQRLNGYCCAWEIMQLNTSENVLLR